MRSSSNEAITLGPGLPVCPAPGQGSNVSRVDPQRQSEDAVRGCGEAQLVPGQQSLLTNQWEEVLQCDVYGAGFPCTPWSRPGNVIMSS